MSKHHLSRKELKENELEDALLDAKDFVVSHQDQTKRYSLIGGGVAVVVALIWGGLALRSNRLDERLSSALGLYDAPLVSDGVPARAGQPVFKDAAERTAAARKALKELAQDAPSSSAGKAAAVLVLAAEGKAGVTGTSVDRVSGFVSSGSRSMSGGFAAATLLEARASAGQTKEAIETGKRYLESSSSPLPKDVLIFLLAQLYEKSNQPAEAKGFYQRLVTDFPDSPMRGEAQQRLTGL